MVRPNHEEPERSRRRTTPAKEVNAQFGTWDYVTDAKGRVKEITGCFPAAELEHVLGTARFLQRSHIQRRRIEMAPDEIERAGDDDGANYILRLTARDDLAKFEKFAHDHNLLPSLREQRQREDMEHEEAHSFAFHPAPQHLVEGAIARLNWQSAAGPREDSLYTTVAQPELAFQVALYLKGHGMLDERQFWRLNEEAKRASGGQEGFRIAVHPEYVHKFERKFSAAGSLKPALGAEWVKKIVAMSAAAER